MGKYYLDMEEYKRLARQAAAEGCVLLKNENNTLPLREGENVSVFGRIQFTYYKKRHRFGRSGEYPLCDRNSGCAPCWKDPFG